MDCLSSEIQDQPGQHGETPSLLKIQKISLTWWHAPVVPATQKAEVGALLEPGSKRLQWAIIVIALQPGQHRKSLSRKKRRTGV